MAYREDQDALLARIASLEEKLAEAGAEHKELERLRADLAHANVELARREITPPATAENPRKSDDVAQPKKRRISTTLRTVGIVLAICGAIAAIVIGASLQHNVQGTIVSEGGKLGSWQVAPTTCNSRGGRFDGFNFFDKNNVNRARVVVDAKGDPSIWVYNDDAKNWGYRADKPDCTTLDTNFTTSSRHNGVAFDGSVAFDCKLAGGRVHASLTFTDCY